MRPSHVVARKARLTLLEKAAGGLLEFLLEGGEIRAWLRLKSGRSELAAVEHESLHDLGFLVRRDGGHALLDEVPLLAEEADEVRVAELRRTFRTDDPVPLRVDQVVETFGNDRGKGVGVRTAEREERRQREVRKESAQGLGRAFGALGRESIERLLVRVGRVQQRDAGMIRGRARESEEGGGQARSQFRARLSAREGKGLALTA